MSKSKKKESKVLRRWLTFLLGVALFIVILKVFHRGFFLSFAGAIVGFIIGSKLFKKDTSGEMLDGVSGVTQGMFDETMTQAREKYRKLRSYEMKISDLSLRKLVVRVNELVKKIIDDVKKDPRDVKTARRFFTYYLDTQINILQKYMDITTHHAAQGSSAETEEKVRRTLGSMEIAYDSLLKKLLENDVFELNTELTVLDQTIRMEGLFEEDK